MCSDERFYEISFRKVRGSDQSIYQKKAIVKEEQFLSEKLDWGKLNLLRPKSASWACKFYVKNEGKGFSRITQCFGQFSRFSMSPRKLRTRISQGQNIPNICNRIPQSS